MFFRNLTFFRFPTTTDFSEVDTLLPQSRIVAMSFCEPRS